MGKARGDDLAALLTQSALTPVKKSVAVAGHATSVTLEPVFWRELARIAAVRGLSRDALFTEIDAARGASDGTLANTLRLYVLRGLAP
ncbi:MAG: ribbon-helix-helix domain-containing protein [Alphaproteobacteria bacterium]|nr:ribbon-helix-helix domain-containing protein [Alphaproteobacteria bacterium]